MTNFLHDQNEDKRAAVMQSLDDQLARMDNVLKLAENPEESEAIRRSTALAAELRGDVDALWALHGEVLAIRGAFW